MTLKDSLLTAILLSSFQHWV